MGDDRESLIPDPNWIGGRNPSEGRVKKDFDYSTEVTERRVLDSIRLSLNPTNTYSVKHEL